MLKTFCENRAKGFEALAAKRAVKLAKQIEKAQQFKKQLDERILEKNINE